MPRPAGGEGQISPCPMQSALQSAFKAGRRAERAPSSAAAGARGDGAREEEVWGQKQQRHLCRAYESAPQGQRSCTPCPGAAPFCPLAWSPLCPWQGWLGTPGQESSWWPGHRRGAGRKGTGQQAPEEGAEPGRIPAPRTLVRLLGAELVLTVVPGCPAPRQRHSRSRRCWSTSLCRAGHPLAQPLTPQKARAETPPQPHKRVPCPCQCPTGTRPL